MLRLILRLVPVKAAQSTEHRAKSTGHRAENLEPKNEKRETINDL